MSSAFDTVIIPTNYAIQAFMRHAFSQVFYCTAAVAFQLVYCIQSYNAYKALPAERRPARRNYLILSLFLLFIHTFMTVLRNVAYFPVLAAPHNKTVEDMVQLIYDAGRSWRLQMADWFFVLITLVGAAFMIFRCSLLWAEKKIVLVLPATAWATELVLALYLLIHSNVNENWTAGNGVVYAAVSFLIITWFSIAGLLAFKLLQIRRNHDDTLAKLDGNISLSARSILAESVLPVAVGAFLVAVTLNKRLQHPSNYKNWDSAEKFSLALYDFSSILAPQIVLWRVLLGQSFGHVARSDGSTNHSDEKSTEKSY